MTQKPEKQPSPAGNGLTAEDLRLINSRRGLQKLLESKRIDVSKVLRRLRYREELRKLQAELIKLQRDVQDSGRRVAIVFEGRDAAGKGGAILRFTRRLSPRAMRIVALPKPTDAERGQWYFQRYVQHLPAPGEIVFFDRSWYNRAVVEPVNGFCTEEQYEIFMRQVTEFENMLYEDGLEMIKFWFAVSKKEQKQRFAERRENELKQWKISPVDERAQDLWDSYTHYANEMLVRTHTPFAPWVIVEADKKRKARLESIRQALFHLPYERKDKADVDLRPDPNVIVRFHRSNRFAT